MSQELLISVVAKDFRVDGRTIPVVRDFSLSVSAGEFVTLLGPSGCGKTTLLRMVLGLDLEYEGEVCLGGEAVVGPSLRIGVVFQEPRLLPWMTVRGNVMFALPEGIERRVATGRVSAALEMVGLAGFENAWPNQLSGGMAQRAAMARALVNRPEVLLLDEPFGSLDSQTRQTMQGELRKAVDEAGTTTLMVTHDIDEAVFLSDRIVTVSPRPASVREIHSCTLPEPRRRHESEFVKLRAAVMESFYA